MKRFPWQAGQTTSTSLKNNMLLVTVPNPSQFSQRPPWLLKEKCLAVKPISLVASKLPKSFLISS